MYFNVFLYNVISKLDGKFEQGEDFDTYGMFRLLVEIGMLFVEM